MNTPFRIAIVVVLVIVLAFTMMLLWLGEFNAVRDSRIEPATYAEMGNGSHFVAYSYRTSSRFGERVDVEVAPRGVTISGPRVGSMAYLIWYIGMAVLLFLAFIALLAAILMLDWRVAVLTVLILLLHLVWSMCGAMGMYDLTNVRQFSDGKRPSVTLPLEKVRQVAVGRGWSRNGVWAVVPYLAPLMENADVVSFEAPSGEERGKAVHDETLVYAFLCLDKEDAQRLAALLSVGEKGYKGPPSAAEMARQKAVAAAAKKRAAEEARRARQEQQRTSPTYGLPPGTVFYP